MHTLEALDGPALWLAHVVEESRITAVALLSLALGIGATTCIFSVIYGVLISPYPYAKANEIWAPEIRDPKNPSPRNGRGIFWPYEFKECRSFREFSVAMGTVRKERY